MNKIIHRADSRGIFNHGWLQSAHTFSFAAYHNPQRMRFGKLRVLNDDTIAPGTGFDTHPHDNMEIITLPISGKLRHRDSMGNESVISSGEVQIMSAGTGVTHSEYNASDVEPLSLLQIWVFPKKLNIAPRYDQKVLDLTTARNQFKRIVSPDTVDQEAVWINQDAYFSLTELERDQTASYHCQLGRPALYIFVIAGEIMVDGEVLHSRDGMALSALQQIDIRANQQAKVLCIETNE